MKIKSLLILLVSAFVVITACNNDDDGDDNFDAAAQALIDDEKLIEYLKSHYYIPASQGETFGIIDTILNNETSLFDDGKLKIQDITRNEINYKLYTYIENEGKNTFAKSADSVLVNYQGFLLDSTKFDERFTYTWFSLPSLAVTGWSYGFTNFKDGDNISQSGEPIEFSETGDGILFIPSGLAYANLGSAGIGPNESLIFHIKLGLVVKADHDNDSILSIYEDADKDDNVNNDDTDGDRLPNYLDGDDDNDGTLTRDENPDPNGDGNPDDALDSDGDGVPDYLDPDTN